MLVLLTLKDFKISFQSLHFYILKLTANQYGREAPDQSVKSFQLGLADKISLFRVYIHTLEDFPLQDILGE
jgi:hypothetical protein